MRNLLLRFAFGVLVGALGIANAQADLLEGPMAALVCKNGVGTGDFDDLRFPLGQIELVLSKKIHCARGPYAQPDEPSWTARFTIAGTAVTRGGDELTFELGAFVSASAQIFIHAQTLSIVAIRQGQEASTREVVRIGVEAGRLRMNRIDVPPSTGHYPAEPIPFWGADAHEPTSRPLSPLLGDELPLRLIDSPWLEIADGLLLDVRSGATRHYRTEQSAGLERLRVLGLGPDVRTLISLAVAEDLLDLRLVLTDTLDGTAEVIPLDLRALGIPRMWYGLPDTSVITPAWVLRHFEVLMRPKGLQLRPRAVRFAPPRASFVSDNDITIGLVCVRATIIPLIVQALQRDWNANFDKEPVTRDKGGHFGVTCARDNSGIVTSLQKTWYGTIGAADVALSFFEDGRVSLMLLGRTLAGDQHDDFSRAADAVARSTFEAVGQYLNDRLREPEWQAQLIEP
jgi:hypothetical protein